MTSEHEWARYFLSLAAAVSQRSKDPRTKVGSIIVRDKRIISTGYNGFPAGVKEHPKRWDAPTKYDFVIHAEENAILHAARFGASIDGADIYCTLKPCARCAKLIAGSGLKRVLYDVGTTDAYDKANPSNPHDFNIGDTMLTEAGVIVKPVT